MQLEQVKCLRRPRIDGIGADKISAAIKIIGQHRRPLRQRQGNVRRSQEVKFLARSSAAAAEFCSTADEFCTVLAVEFCFAIAELCTILAADSCSIGCSDFTVDFATVFAIEPNGTAVRCGDSTVQL